MFCLKTTIPTRLLGVAGWSHSFQQELNGWLSDTPVAELWGHIIWTGLIFSAASGVPIPFKQCHICLTTIYLSYLYRDHIHFWPRKFQWGIFKVNCLLKDSSQLYSEHLSSLSRSNVLFSIIQAKFDVFFSLESGEWSGAAIMHVQSTRIL